MNTRHAFRPHPKYPWFCGACGYAPHEELMHGRDWMLVCNAAGAALYWIAADGTKLPPSDPPPRSEWAAEMREGRS